jgi:hypothetical protein
MHLRAKNLADRFEGASVRRMAQGNERGAPTEPLFHYTTADALLAIIGSETFRFTSVYHMDDDQELLFGFGISHSLLSAAMEREDLNVKTFLKPLVEDVGFDRIKNRFEFYSASFGQKDDPRQWTDYADGGKGVASSRRKRYSSARSNTVSLPRRSATPPSWTAPSRPSDRPTSRVSC